MQTGSCSGDLRMHDLPCEASPETGDASTPACHGLGVGGANREEEELLKTGVLE